MGQQCERQDRLLIMRSTGNEYADPREHSNSKGRWPRGQYWAPHEDLGAVLSEMGEAHAHFAVRQWASGDRFAALQAAISAGCAVELLTKAHLASIEPTLIAQRSDPATILHLSGLGTRVESGPTEITTLGALEALKVAKMLSPEIAFTQSDNVVFRARNAAAHMAILDQHELGRAIASMVRIVDSLIAVSPWPDRAEFWTEDLLPAVDAAAQTARSESHARLAAKLASARAHVTRLLDGLDSATEAVLRRSLAARSPWTSVEYEMRADCPACGESGWLICGLEDVFSDEVFDDGSVISQVTGKTAWPLFFNCNVCGLDLEQDEVREVDEFPYSIDLELDFDEEDF